MNNTVMLATKTFTKYFYTPYEEYEWPAKGNIDSENRRYKIRLLININFILRSMVLFNRVIISRRYFQLIVYNENPVSFQV